MVWNSKSNFRAGWAGERPRRIGAKGFIAWKPI